ncbi:MAG: MFS transporter [Pseudomonadota bacterium]
MSEAPSQPEQQNRFVAFTYAAYAKYWMSRFLATLAAQIIAVAVGWQVYDLTRDPLDLGIIGLVQFLPVLFLVFITGTVADRFGRRNVMAISIFVEMLCALGILYFSWRGLTSPIPIFVALAIFGAARAFLGPASQSLVVNLVPRHIFPNAVAWNSSAWQVATIGGPVMGGLLYGLGANVAYIVATVLIGAALLLILMIPKPKEKTETEQVTLSSLFEGIRYLHKQPVVLGAISLDLFAVLLGGAVALLPVFARDILETGPWGLGLLRAAPGVGAVLTALLLTASPIRDNAGRVLLVCVALFGLFTVVFGFSTLTWLSVLALFMVGATDAVSVYIRETVIQLWTPDEVRGRVNAINMVFIGASNELGDFRGGAMAAWIGAVPAVVLGGAGAMGVAVAWAYLFPQLRDVRYLDRRE